MRSLGGLNRRPVLLFPDGVVSVVPGSKDLIFDIEFGIKSFRQRGTWHCCCIWALRDCQNRQDVASYTIDGPVTLPFPEMNPNVRGIYLFSARIQPS